MTRSRLSLPSTSAPRGLTRRAATTLAFASISALVLAGCGGGDSGDAGSGGDGGGEKQVIAAIFSGPTNDADYNAVGLKALKAAESAGAEISFSEKVAVPDVEARLTEAVGDGATVVWTHGSQFYDATAKVAKNNPDVNFIAEYDGVPKDQPANVWTIDRQFHLGFYGMGVFASKAEQDRHRRLRRWSVAAVLDGRGPRHGAGHQRHRRDDEDQARLDRRLQRRRQGTAVLHPGSSARAPTSSSARSTSARPAPSRPSRDVPRATAGSPRSTPTRPRPPASTTRAASSTTSTSRSPTSSARSRVARRRATTSSASTPA